MNVAVGTGDCDRDWYFLQSVASTLRSVGVGSHPINIVSRLRSGIDSTCGRGVGELPHPRLASVSLTVRSFHCGQSRFYALRSESVLHYGWRRFLRLRSISSTHFTASMIYAWSESVSAPVVR